MPGLLLSVFGIRGPGALQRHAVAQLGCGRPAGASSLESQAGPPPQFLDLELEVEAGCLCGLIKAHN